MRNAVDQVEPRRAWRKLGDGVILGGGPSDYHFTIGRRDCDICITREGRRHDVGQQHSILHALYVHLQPPID